MFQSSDNTTGKKFSNCQLQHLHSMTYKLKYSTDCAIKDVDLGNIKTNINSQMSNLRVQLKTRLFLKNLRTRSEFFSSCVHVFTNMSTTPLEPCTLSKNYNNLLAALTFLSSYYSNYN